MSRRKESAQSRETKDKLDMSLRQQLIRYSSRAYAALWGNPVGAAPLVGSAHGQAVSSAAGTLTSSTTARSSMLPSQQLQAVRGYGKPPSEAGGPAKGYSSFKRRFKMTGSGAIRAMSPGFVHKRFNKSNKRLNRLSKGILVPPSYEKMMKQLGFTSRKF